MTPTKPLEAPELEAHISDSERLMLTASEIWEREGCFAAKGDADRLAMQRDGLLREVEAY